MSDVLNFIIDFTAPLLFVIAGIVLVVIIQVIYSATKEVIDAHNRDNHASQGSPKSDRSYPLHYTRRQLQRQVQVGQADDDSKAS